MGRRVIARLERALRELHPRASLRAACARLPKRRRWGVILLGKDAASLMEGVALPDCRGILVAPPDRLPARAPRRWTVLPGAHPVPDRSSFEAGDALLRFAADPAFDAFLVGLTGGGSALAEAPLRPWFNRADLAACHRDLLASGLPITAMNAVRKRLSALKGGRLASAMGGRPAWTFLISDVPAGRGDAVASGPTLPDASTRCEVRRALRALPPRRWAVKLRALLEAGRLPEPPGAGDSAFRGQRHRVLADNGLLLQRLAAGLREEGFRVAVLAANADGTADAAVAGVWRAFLSLRPRQALLLGGEFTVALPPRPGRGGRVSHLALLFLERLLAHGAPFPFGFVGMATDGGDGTSPGAGVFLDGPVGTSAEVCAHLAAHDAGSYFQRRGLLLPPLWDRLNLRDCFILWRAA